MPGTWFNLFKGQISQYRNSRDNIGNLKLCQREKEEFLDQLEVVVQCGVCVCVCVFISLQFYDQFDLFLLFFSHSTKCNPCPQQAFNKY